MPDPAPNTTDPLDLALRCAQVGLRVLPIPNGKKHPPMAAWQDAATIDPLVIGAWWTGLYAGHGIGLAPDQLPDGRWWFVVDIDQHGVDGAAVWADICDAYEPVPDTVEATTGGGGSHLLFASPRQIRNGRLGDGIDIRGKGGQIVAEPSIHPSGNPYSWVDGQAPWEHDIIDAPGWLLSMLEPEPVQRPERTLSADTGDRPGDIWAMVTSWADILEPDGWQLHHIDRSGEEYWTRPGKERRDGPSATVGHKGSDVLKVFTSSMHGAGLAQDATYSKIGYLAATRFGGTDNIGTAASALRAAGYKAERLPSLADVMGSSLTNPTTVPTSPPQAPAEPAEPVAGDWSPMDLAAALDGTVDAPHPTILGAPGGTPLFYAGRVNTIFGESGAGKTWVELAAIAEVLAGGGCAVLIDLEDTPAGIISRLRLLGVDDAIIAERFLYVSPQTSWGPAAQASMAALVDDRRPELVCIDSTGEAMAASGVKGNDDDDVARWFVAFPKFIARRGPAVLIVDHVPKDPNAPSHYMIGSQRKVAAVDGAAYRIDAVKVPSRADDGLLKVITAKDRHGNHTKGKVAAMVAVTHSVLGDGITITLSDADAAPVDDEGNFRPTIIMQRVSEVVESTPGLSGREIESRTPGKAKTVREAHRLLLMEGFIEQDPAARGFAYRSVRPFRAGDENVTPDAISTTSPEAPRPRVPTASPPRPPLGDAVPDTPRPLPPPPTGQGRGGASVESLKNELTASPDGAQQIGVDHDPWDLGLSAPDGAPA